MIGSIPNTLFKILGDRQQDYVQAPSVAKRSREELVEVPFEEEEEVHQ